MKTIECYDFIELRVHTEKAPEAVFSLGDETTKVKGFQIAQGEYAVRFMPKKQGTWTYSAGDVHGEFICVPAEKTNHGKVMTDGMGFRCEDGTVFIPMGTTCYAWTHQPKALIAQTLETLKSSPFNKIRMGVFPKSMPYNNNDPEFYPFNKDSEGKWDVTAPNFEYWDHLDTMLLSLRDMGIEADLILFHPYDRWGFANFTTEECLAYVDYCIRRLSAHRNLWWSLANEYDLVSARTMEDWDLVGEKLLADDPYRHLIGIHNCLAPYPKKRWMSHCSMQTKEVKNVLKWLTAYELPVVIDECCYEGNIEYEWGNISAFELIHRAWITAACGGYFTHGETFHREDEVLWWAKGGQLYGESPARLGFLRSIQEEIGHIAPCANQWSFNPNDAADAGLPKPEENVFLRAILALPDLERNQVLESFMPLMGHNENHLVHYLGRHCPVTMELHLPENGEYRIEVIDIWEMTRTVFTESAHGTIRVALPGKEGIAVLATRVKGDVL